MSATLPGYLRFTGSKRYSIPVLSGIFQRFTSRRRFIDVFAGSGIVALNAFFPKIVINDINRDIIRLHRLACEVPEKLISEAHVILSGHRGRDGYFRLREAFNKETDEHQRAVMLLCLNITGYNGVIRYNKSGNFNVPFGNVDDPVIPEERILRFSRYLRGHAVFSHEDAFSLLSRVSRDDLVYCDPPYLSENRSSLFDNDFGLAEHERLAALLAEIPATAVLSMGDTPLARSIYGKADYMGNFDVSRRIGNRNGGGGRGQELVLIWHP